MVEYLQKDWTYNTTIRYVTYPSLSTTGASILVECIRVKDEIISKNYKIVIHSIVIHGNSSEIHVITIWSVFN